MPLASLGTAQRSPAGRRAISHWAFATSIPTKHGTSTRGTPVCPTLQIQAQWHQTTVRARGVQDVTTHAPLRSRRTKAKSVYHVRVLRDGDSPTSPLKDTRLEAVRCRVEPMVTHPAPPQTRTCAIHASGSSSKAAAARACKDPLAP